MENNISVLMKSPAQRPKQVVLENSLPVLQAAVAGHIEVLPLEDGVVLIVNEEGKLQDLPANFLLGSLIPGSFDTIVGTAIIAGLDDDGWFASLTDAQLDLYTRKIYGFEREVASCAARPSPGREA